MASLRLSIACGRARYIDTRELHGAAAVESIAMDGQSIGSEVATAVTHNSDLLGRGARLGLGSRRTRTVYGRRSHKMKQTQTHACMVSGGRRGSIVLAGERKGSSSHSGEWRGTR